MNENNNEAFLLQSALYYENGHQRRTEHILKVYALAKLLGEQENLSSEERKILQAAAILHDIAIKYCKEHENGDASQEKQQLVAPSLVEQFLNDAGYPSSYLPQITSLVLNHHNYTGSKSKILQLLIEADLIVNCYENPPSKEKAEWIKSLFRTPVGTTLLTLCIDASVTL